MSKNVCFSNFRWLIWKNYWNKKVFKKNFFQQVQRTSKGLNLSEKELFHSVNFISKNISAKDIVLDICCGNGLITSQIICKSIIGVDFSKHLISIAQANFINQNIQFICADALYIDKLFNYQFDKIILNFSFQYFNFHEGKELIFKMSNLLKQDGLIYISDIPNKHKQHLFAGNGLQKLKYYIKYYLKKEPTGKFWSQKELDSICNSYNLKGVVVEQPKYLPYSHYRFDYLISKN